MEMRRKAPTEHGRSHNSTFQIVVVKFLTSSSKICEQGDAEVFGAAVVSLCTTHVVKSIS